MGDFKMGSKTVLSQSGTNDPTWGANAPPGMVIEEFCSPCDGSAITVQSGTYTLGNVSAGQDFTDSYADVTGSSITYTPPTGTQTVVYSFNFHVSGEGTHQSLIGHTRLYLAGAEVVYARHTFADQTGYDERSATIIWSFNIGGSADANTGRVATWTSGKEIKLQARRYSSSHKMSFHETFHFDGANSNQLHVPILNIKALA